MKLLVMVKKGFFKEVPQLPLFFFFLNTGPFTVVISSFFYFSVKD